MLRGLLPLLLLVPVCGALAQTGAETSEAPEFDVEIIVFRHVDADQTELATAPVEEAEPETRPRRVRFETLAPEALRLGGINQALLRSAEWSPILHAGWRQPAQAHEDAAAMPVAGRRGSGYVSGTVRLSLERYLRLEIDLDLDDGSGRPLRLVQARRIRSGRIHYFDHPHFGVIALVSRPE